MVSFVSLLLVYPEALISSSRTDWPADAQAALDMTSLMSTAKAGKDGYMNVASAVGLSGARDYSTYHRPWVDSHFGRRRGRHSWLYDDFDNGY